jgi:hypothetical protein
MIHQPSSRALAIARGLVRTKRASSGAVFEGAANHFLRLPALQGAFYWISFDGVRVLRGDGPEGPEYADELQDGFIEAMARAGKER